jgi:hypothetical protein
MTNEENKLLSYKDGVLIATVEYTTHKHLENSWQFIIWVRVADDYNNAGNRSERIENDHRYLAIIGESGFDTRGLALQSAINQISEILPKIDED